LLNLIQIPTQKVLGLIGYWINHFYLIMIILIFFTRHDFRLDLIRSTKLMKTQLSQTSLIIIISFFFYLINIIIIVLQDINLNGF
jgi:hypothetical protein